MRKLLILVVALVGCTKQIYFGQKFRVRDGFYKDCEGYAFEKEGSKVILDVTACPVNRHLPDHIVTSTSNLQELEVEAGNE